MHFGNTLKKYFQLKKKVDDHFNAKAEKKHESVANNNNESEQQRILLIFIDEDGQA